jgi:hypothetical protein
MRTGDLPNAPRRGSGWFFNPRLETLVVAFGDRVFLIRGVE